MMKQYRNSTVANFATVEIEGNRRVSRNIDYYNLDMIIAVGYRTNSKKATKFRQWATEVLKSYLIKGYSINKEKLKKPNKYGKDYFDELLEIIKEIRTSERRFYQKVTDIFAECSIDYNKNTEIANDFYATIQNKFHYAITNETAAEIICHRANSKKRHMGLTTWKYSPDGKISAEEAKEFAEKEFEKFRVEQDKQYLSDFDKIISECKNKKSINVKVGGGC